MAQTILLFRINRDKYAVIQNVCRTLGIRIIDVARKDYSQKLGTLAQIQGFTREAKKYDGPEFPAEMLIFSEMNSDQVDVFLAEYKSGTSPRKILEDHGFDISIIGERRIWSISNHIRTEYKKYGEFHEGYRPRSVPAADASDDTGSKNNSDADKIKQLQQEVDYLKQEMEFLKKISSIRTTRK